MKKASTDYGHFSSSKELVQALKSHDMQQTKAQKSHTGALNGRVPARDPDGSSQSYTSDASEC